MSQSGTPPRTTAEQATAVDTSIHAKGDDWKVAAMASTNGKTITAANAGDAMAEYLIEPGVAVRPLAAAQLSTADEGLVQDTAASLIKNGITKAELLKYRAGLETTDLAEIQTSLDKDPSSVAGQSEDAALMQAAQLGLDRVLGAMPDSTLVLNISISQ